MSDIVVLDGGLGQEIQKRSNEAAHPLWSVKVMFEKPELGIPIGGYANGFKSVEPLTPGSTVDNLSSRKELTPENYFKFVTEWINDGATIIGGCCEISPIHIGYICKMLELNGHNITKIKI